MHKKSPVRGGENFAFILLQNFLRAPREFYGVPADYILGLKMGLKYSK